MQLFRTIRRALQRRSDPASGSEPPRISHGGALAPQSRPEPPSGPRTTVLGYTSLPAGDPAAPAINAAAAAIEAWCETRGWTLDRVVHDVEPQSGRVADRPGLAHVFDEIRAGRATGVVVPRLRDLTRSVTEIGPVLEWFTGADAFLIALDYELDTSKRSGVLAARALVDISGWERGRVAGRNRPGLAARSPQAVRDDPELKGWITTMRSDGMSLQAIADALNAAGIPTLRGGTHWRPSSVQAAAGYKRPSPRIRGSELRRSDGTD